MMKSRKKERKQTQFLGAIELCVLKEKCVFFLPRKELNKPVVIELSHLLLKLFLDLPDAVYDSRDAPQCIRTNARFYSRGKYFWIMCTLTLILRGISVK